MAVGGDFVNIAGVFQEGGGEFLIDQVVFGDEDFGPGGGGRAGGGAISGRSVGRRGAGAGGSSGTVNQKVEPRPGWLSTPMVPPINSTSCLQMARPRPVPPYWRVVEESTWEKLLNRRARRSGAMPMPESLTAKRRMVCCSRRPSTPQ